ncbi:MAG TPA: long-chain fatty acid--CoA ligase [Acidobacteriaceae bacterium]|nr:long-chain fatty acid--CoA ligase [Acidobacteriaceae bacterium]
MFKLETLVDVIGLVAASKRERAVLWQDGPGRWHPMSSDELVTHVYALANVFLSWGIVKGDRIALLAENRWEWPVVDFATLVLGAADVPIYPTLTADQVAALLIDSGARVAVVSTEAQYRKVASIAGRTPLEHVIVMDAVVGLEGNGVTLPSLIEGAAKPSVDVQQWLGSFGVRPEDLATLIYTSGTTGEPKGVMLTHGNVASNLNHSTLAFNWNPDSSCISFLPLSHITARHLDYALFCYGATLAYCTNFDRLPAALAAIRPTVFVAVPRVYEKIREVAERRSNRKPIVKKLFAWALETGKRHREQILQGKKPTSPSWLLANALVFKKVKQAFGGRVRDYIAGGAPLGIDTAAWFADVGIRIFEGYGLTETSPVVALNNAKDHRIGSVGKAIDSVEYHFAPDGELLVRGPFVFTGYWHKPEATREVIEPDGWFHTGDIGRVDEDGFLYITDRKKELLKTSGGKMIAPAPIESKLNQSPLVANAVVVGDKHKFLSVLIAPNFPALETAAQQKGIAFSSRDELVAHPDVRAQYQALLRSVNESLANFETLKRFHLVSDEWSIASGELTPTMKLKRRVVVERYADEIAGLYHDESVAQR